MECQRGTWRRVVARACVQKRGGERKDGESTVPVPGARTLCARRKKDCLTHVDVEKDGVATSTKDAGTEDDEEEEDNGRRGREREKKKKKTIKCQRLLLLREGEGHDVVVRMSETFGPWETCRPRGGTAGPEEGSGTHGDRLRMSGEGGRDDGCRKVSGDATKSGGVRRVFGRRRDGARWSRGER